MVCGTIVYNLEVHCQRITQIKCGLYCASRVEDFSGFREYFSDFRGADFPNDLQINVTDERFYIIDTNWWQKIKLTMNGHHIRSAPLNHKATYTPWMTSSHVKSLFIKSLYNITMGLNECNVLRVKMWKWNWFIMKFPDHFD